MSIKHKLPSGILLARLISKQNYTTQHQHVSQSTDVILMCGDRDQIRDDSLVCFTHKQIKFHTLLNTHSHMTLHRDTIISIHVRL